MGLYEMVKDGKIGIGACETFSYRSRDFSLGAYLFPYFVYFGFDGFCGHCSYRYVGDVIAKMIEGCFIVSCGFYDTKFTALITWEVGEFFGFQRFQRVSFARCKILHRFVGFGLG